MTQQNSKIKETLTALNKLNYCINNLNVDDVSANDLKTITYFLDTQLSKICGLKNSLCELTRKDTVKIPIQRISIIPEANMETLELEDF